MTGRRIIEGVGLICGDLKELPMYHLTDVERRHLRDLLLVLHEYERCLSANIVFPYPPEKPHYY